MKYELPCAIVRDLLPLYMEGLTEVETNVYVKEHLTNCTDCRNMYETMLGSKSVDATEEKEVDYLKTIRKKNSKKVILSVILTLALVLAGIGIKLLWVGNSCDGSSVAVSVALSEEGGNLIVNLNEMNSANAIVGLKAKMDGDVIDITAREVMVSPLSGDSHTSMTVPLDGVRTVKAFGHTIWQDGMIIDIRTNRLIEAKVPYVGDAPAVGQLIYDMNMDAPSTLKLQTASQPYGVTIHFTEVIDKNRRYIVEGNAYILLALVDNLGEVYWDDPSGYTGSLTLDEANNAIRDLIDTYNTSHNTEFVPHTNVKDFGVDIYNLQLLRNVLGI